MPTPILRTRPIAVGHLRAFAAVARHLNFRAAADELSLTQSAVSRQIQGLEEEVGVALFLRHTRAVELTSAGGQLLAALLPGLERIDSAVRQIRQTAGRQSVAITTWASFASMWLIPRLEAFQREYPDIDIRIDTSDQHVDLDTADVDLALRYSYAPNRPAAAELLFGEYLAVVASPWLLKTGIRLAQPSDVAQCTLIQATDTHRAPWLDRLSWLRWLGDQGVPKLQPKRWLYFNYASQIAQAALAGQGLALARVPLVADSLASGDLVEVMPDRRVASEMSYWLMVGPRAQRPEVAQFCDWLRREAALTRATMESPPAG